MRLLATVIGLCEAAATATARGRRREDEGLAGGGRAEGAADRVVGGGRGASEERGEVGDRTGGAPAESRRARTRQSTERGEFGVATKVI